MREDVRAAPVTVATRSKLSRFGAMLRLFLHIQDGEGLLHDEEGRVFESVDQARAAAVCSARELLCETLSQGVLDLKGWIDIADEAGTKLERVRFSDVVEIK